MNIATKKVYPKDVSCLSIEESTWINSKLSPSNLQSATNCSILPFDHQTYLQIAIQEIKEFRKIIILLLKELIQILDHVPIVEWTLATKSFLFETANDVIFGSNVLFYKTLMNLISLALSEKQDEINQIAGKIKNWTQKEFEIHPNFRMEGEPYPYLTVIETVNMVSQHYTPEDKFRTVCATKSQLVKAIDNYWAVKDPDKSSAELAISADELLPLYVYIMSKSNTSKILCEIFFIEQFLDNHSLLFSEDSYFFATVSSAVSYILSLAK